MIEKRKLKKGDILLLLLYVNDCKPIKGRTRLQKMVFVFEREILKKYGFNKILETEDNSYFNFQSYNYGPFSKDIFKLMDFFVNIGMVDVEYELQSEEAIEDEDISISDFNESKIELGDEEISFGAPTYRISKKGKEYIEKRILRFLKPEQIKILEKLKESFNKYSIYKILRHIYNKYPEMAESSLIKGKIQEDKWTY